MNNRYEKIETRLTTAMNIVSTAINKSCITLTYREVSKISHVSDLIKIVYYELEEADMDEGEEQKKIDTFIEGVQQENL